MSKGNTIDIDESNREPIAIDNYFVFEALIEDCVRRCQANVNSSGKTADTAIGA